MSNEVRMPEGIDVAVDQWIPLTEWVAAPITRADAVGDWFVTMGDSSLGPLSLSEVETYWEGGKLNETSLAWTPGMREWKPLVDVPQLTYLLIAIPQLQRAAAAPAAPAWRDLQAASLKALIAREADHDARPTPVAPMRIPSAVGLPQLPAVVAEPDEQLDPFRVASTHEVATTIGSFPVPWTTHDLPPRARAVRLGFAVSAGLVLAMGVVLVTLLGQYVPPEAVAKADWAWRHLLAESWPRPAGPFITDEATPGSETAPAGLPLVPVLAPEATPGSETAPAELPLVPVLADDATPGLETVPPDLQLAPVPTSVRGSNTVVNDPGARRISRRTAKGMAPSAVDPVADSGTGSAVSTAPHGDAVAAQDSVGGAATSFTADPGTESIASVGGDTVADRAVDSTGDTLSYLTGASSVELVEDVGLDAPGLARQDIIAGVKENGSNLATCIRAAYARQEILAGPLTFVLSWVIMPDGSLTQPQVEGPPEILSTSLPTCVAVAMYAWTFRAVGQTSRIRNFPLPTTVR